MNYKSWVLNKKYLFINSIAIVAISIIYLLPKLVLEKNNNSQTNLISVDEVFTDKPWRTVLPQLKPVKGVDGVKASDCGKCHTEIYQEWKTSTHSQALHDLQFQAELSKDPSVAWICLNCHIPVQNQRENILVGLGDGNFRKPVFKNNPDFDPVMRDEGVTCATCHIRQDEKGESIVIGSHGNTKPPHPVVIDKKALRNRCQDCHNQEYVLDASLICYFRTGTEMAESKHIKKSDAYCSNCHMPEVKRSLVKKDMNRPVRNSHRHTFWGGGIPKNFDLYKHLKNSGFESALNIGRIQVSPIHFDKEKNNIEYNINFFVENTNPAHYLPTGDPERFIRIEVELLSDSGEILATETVRIGQDWEWWPKAKKIGDNRLQPKEKRTMSVSLKYDSNAKLGKPKSILIKATNNRLTKENAESLKQRYKNVPEIYSEKIQNLEQHYPFSTKILELEYDLATKKTLEIKK